MTMLYRKLALIELKCTETLSLPPPTYCTYALQRPSPSLPPPTYALQSFPVSCIVIAFLQSLTSAAKLLPGSPENLQCFLQSHSLSYSFFRSPSNLQSSLWGHPVSSNVFLSPFKLDAFLELQCKLQNIFLSYSVIFRAYPRITHLATEYFKIPPTKL